MIFEGNLVIHTTDRTAAGEARISTWAETERGFMILGRVLTDEKRGCMFETQM